MAMYTYSQEVFRLKLKMLLKKQGLYVSKTELPNLIVLTSLILMQLLTEVSSAVYGISQAINSYSSFIMILPKLVSAH